MVVTVECSGSVEVGLRVPMQFKRGVVRRRVPNLGVTPYGTNLELTPPHTTSKGSMKSSFSYPDSIYT
jgi:hypothetical protein